MKDITRVINNCCLKNRYQAILLWIIVGFIIYFSFLSITRVYSFNSYYYDLGIFDQVVYNTSRGRILEMTNQAFNKNLNRLAIHFDPILIFFAIPYWFFPHFSILLFFQVLIVATGAMAIYKLSQLMIKNNFISFFFAVIYLLNFQIQRAILFDFHPVVLSTSFLLWAAYFYEKRRFFCFYLMIFLSLLTKEHVGLVILFWGVYLFLIKKDFKNSLLAGFLGLLFFILANQFIIPYFRGEAHFAIRYYSDLGGSMKEVFLNLIKNPLLIFEKLISQENFEYHRRLLFGNFFSLFSFPTFLISLPEYLINLLSKNSNMRGYYFHYQSIIVAFSFYSLILGYKKFSQLFKSPLIHQGAMIIFIVGNLFLYHHYSPLPFFSREPVKYSVDKNKIKSVLLWQKKLADEKIKMATTPKLAPFFTQRISYYNFLYDPTFHSLGYTDEEIFSKKKDVYKLADYIVIFKEEINTKPARQIFKNFQEDKNYQLLYNKNSILVFKKR